MNLRVDKNGVLWFPKNVKFISQKECFQREDIVKIVFSDDVHIIKEKAFFGCKNLREIYFSSNAECTIIGEKAFAGCQNLKKIRFPKTLKVIEEGAFEGDKAIEKVYFPPFLEKIEKNSFRDCDSLTSIYFSGGEAVNLHNFAFSGCKNLQCVFCKQKEYEAMVFHSKYLSIVTGTYKSGKTIMMQLKMIAGFVSGKPIGKFIYLFFGPSKGRWGEGFHLKEAREDWFFWQNLEKERERILQETTMDSVLGIRDMRIIMGTCNIGTTLFCQELNIDLNIQKPLFEMKKIISRIEKFFHKNVWFEAFWDFCKVVELNKK